LKDIVAWLAFGRVWARRPRTASEALPTMVTWAQQQCELLRNGQRIFGFVEHAQAGVMEHERMTAAQIEQRNLISTQARRFFGERSWMVDAP
jgi:hypothetical protein